MKHDVGRAGGRWRGWLAAEITGGLTGGAVSLPANIPDGVVAFAPLGASMAGAGIVSVLIATVLGGAVFMALRRTAGLQAGGTMSMSLVVAGVLATLVEQGALVPGPQGAAAAFAVVAAIGLLTGLFVALFTLGGAGAIVPLIPFPVIAGVVNGTACLMLLTQARPFIGLSPADAEPSWAHPGALLVALVTLVFMLWRIPTLERLPRVLVALVAGTAAHWGLTELAAYGWNDGAFTGPVLGSFPDAITQLRLVHGGIEKLASLPYDEIAVTLVPAAISIAMLIMLDALTGASAIQDRSGAHGSARRDLFATALGNAASGLAGGLPITPSASASFVTWQAGGRTRVAGFVRLSVILLGVLVLPRLLAELPLAVVAGIVVANAWRLFDREGPRILLRSMRVRPRRPAELAGNAAVMLCVTASGVIWGMRAAVLLGFVLSLLLFVFAMAQSAVRRAYASPVGRSRIRRPEHETHALIAEQGAIRVIELQGALFFGSADQLARNIEDAIAQGARHVILDLRRLTRVDLSGARRLHQIADRFWRQGTDLAIAGLRPGTQVWDYFLDVGVADRLPSARLFASLEDAAAHAEGALLDGRGGTASLTPRTALVELGLSGVVDMLLPLAQERHFAAGEALIRAGERATALYVLLEGSVDVWISSGEGAQTRVATLTAGTMVGEMAFVSGAPRSADVWARSAVRALRLDTDCIVRLRGTDPDAPYALMRAIAAQLDRSMRLANAAIASYEE